MEFSAVQRELSSADPRVVRGPRRLQDPELETVEWVGAGPTSRSLERQLEMAGESEAPVLLEGETGVGKDLAARLVHQYSSRRESPWVAVNATSFGEALFESELFGQPKGSFSDTHDHHLGLARSADGGTLFLDEIGELSRVGQSKLLRFLDHREVRPVGSCETAILDVRFVCATNRDLVREVDKGRFRRDLYYRLRVLSILVPPLRERREDIPPLVRHYCKRFGERFQKEVAVDAEAMDLLMAYDWPGNVRELVNEVKRVVVLMPEDGSAGVDLLSPRITSGRRTSSRRARSLKQRSGELEKRRILETLEWTGWNVSAAARELDMSRVGLAKKMRRLDIRRPERRSSIG